LLVIGVFFANCAYGQQSPEPFFYLPFNDEQEIRDVSLMDYEHKVNYFT
jgi:hypothetical protein